MFNVYLIWGWFSGIQTGTVSGDQVPPIQVAPWVHIYFITRGPGSQYTGGTLVHLYCSSRGPGSQYTGGPLGSYILYYKGTRFPIYRWHPGFIYIVVQGDQVRNIQVAPSGFIYIVVQGDQVPNIQVAPGVHIYCSTRGPGSQYTGGPLVHIYCSTRGPGSQYTGGTLVHIYCSTRGPGSPYTGGPLGSYIL